jgi:hypothetical protein
MLTGFSAPLAATFASLVLALVLTRMWANATVSHAARQLSILGMRPGRSYKLGAAWVLLAARDRRNLLWAILSVVAWAAVVVSLHFARQ